MARASDNSIRKTARNAIKSQYTTSGKPIVNDVFPHDEAVSHDEVTDSREFTDIMINNLNDVDRIQWESTKQLYALGRRNFLRRKSSASLSKPSVVDMVNVFSFWHNLL